MVCPNCKGDRCGYACLAESQSHVAIKKPNISMTIEIGNAKWIEQEKNLKIVLFLSRQ